MSGHRPIYFFGTDDDVEELPGKEVLGGKGSGLAHMARLGLPVPPGFTITTEVCLAYDAASGGLPEGVRDEIERAVQRLEVALADGRGTGPRFGDAAHPLLLSCRSGARVSMPGMMDTVLNIGLNDVTVRGLAEQAGDERFAYDAYRRFIGMFGDVVLGVEHHRFEEALTAVRVAEGVEHDHQISVDGLKGLTRQYRDLIDSQADHPLPMDPIDQLIEAVTAVFGSWNNPRAQAYRQAHRIPDDWGTAANVQVMVFGNLGETSATGVAFTRNPATGENRLYGEYLINAQGEDVVAGIRTPGPLSRADGENSLEETMPAAHAELLRWSGILEDHYREMQDLEFTVQKGTSYILQTRSGKRTTAAAVRIAVEMVGEGLIDQKTAIQRVDPDQLDQLLHPRIDPSAPVEILARGLPASPGAASGAIVFHPDQAEAAAAQHRPTILVRQETSPEDIRGMIAAQGVLTARGGMTSHAAVVSRGMGKPCVAGCRDIEVDYRENLFRVGVQVYRAGDVITIDGGDGRVMAGEVPRIQPSFEGPIETLMRWADDLRSLGVWTNADTPEDAATARRFGAEGIGLCRTEHMFFAEDRIDQVRRMILAESGDERASVLDRLRAAQIEDFEGIFRAMDGLPVTIRLLDPPLHEFLPHSDAEIGELAERLEVDAESVRRRVTQLAEFNPMLGHRGCRLGITAPEIYRMQARAILEAALSVAAEGVQVRPEIMVPLVATRSELATVRAAVDGVAEAVFGAAGQRVDYEVGTMIELPRACVTAAEIAEVADFFSFGTNDLTQTTFGLSRDDAGSFLPAYVDQKILGRDPFVSIDVSGVGQLMRLGLEGGRRTRPHLKVGICGEHGGEPDSVRFCHELGLDYVSCSPFRVPIARLAAAQAAVIGSQWRDETL